MSKPWHFHILLSITFTIQEHNNFYSRGNAEMPVIFWPSEEQRPCGSQQGLVGLKLPTGGRSCPCEGVLPRSLFMYDLSGVQCQ